MPLEAKESEDYVYLAQTCRADLPRVFFKVLLYDSILHSEIINDLILLLDNSSIDDIHKECVNYAKNNMDMISKHIKDEEQALRALEAKILKNIDDHLLEALIQYIYEDEESHIRLLKALLKEART